MWISNTAIDFFQVRHICLLWLFEYTIFMYVWIISKLVKYLVHFNLWPATECNIWRNPSIIIINLEHVCKNKITYESFYCLTYIFLTVVGLTMTETQEPLTIWLRFILILIRMASPRHCKHIYVTCWLTGPQTVRHLYNRSTEYMYYYFIMPILNG